MADKAISQLNAATSVNSLDLFVLEQSGEAKKLTGQILENWLVSFADGHGGIQSISKTSTTGTNPVIDTYTIVYADETTSTFTVTNGIKGDTGAQTYVWIKYSENYPTADSDMSSSPDNWMGIYAGTASTAPAHYTDYVWFEIKGETGETGAAATITAATVGYQQSDSGAVVPEGSWTTTVPSPVAGKFLWTRIQIQFNTGSPITAYSVSRYGIDGTGAVSSVNSVSPDQYGNVQLVAGDIQALDSQSVQAHLDDDEQDIADLKTSLSKVRKRNFILIGDSFSIGVTTDTPGTSGYRNVGGWATRAKTVLESLGCQAYVNTTALPGTSGFASTLPFLTMLQAIENDQVPNNDDITDIIVLGGTNDISYASGVVSAIEDFMDYCSDHFKNAMVKIGVIGSDIYNLSQTIQPLYNQCGLYGGIYLGDVLNLFSDPQYICADGTHLTEAGYIFYQKWIFDCIINGHTNYSHKYTVNLTASGINTSSDAFQVDLCSTPSGIQVVVRSGGSDGKITFSSIPGNNSVIFTCASTLRLPAYYDYIVSMPYFGINGSSKAEFVGYLYLFTADGSKLLVNRSWPIVSVTGISSYMTYIPTMKNSVYSSD